MGDTAYLMFEGRLDTAASQQAMGALENVLATVNPTEHLVLDASKLTYISSSGLRILLMLRKRFVSFKLIEANQEIYEILEMTGFTKMMPVERSMRQMSVEGCEKIGQGGVGVVYRVNDDTIIKVFREGSDINEVRREITMAKEAFVLGMPTAISFDVVKVGSQYGLVYELLKADTLSACISKNPADIDKYARLYADLFRQLHEIRVPDNGLIPNVMQREEEAVRHIERYLDSASVDLLLNILSNIPNGDRLLHCDLQTKNAMMQGEELMLIDMGEVGFGHPVIDLGHAHSAMVALVGDYEQIIGIKPEMGKDLWKRAMRYYFEGLSEAEFAHRMEQIEAVSVIRNFSWLSLSDTFPEQVIRQCQEVFKERAWNRRDYLLDVSKTLADWTLD